jgi:hypothetical protein
MFSFVANTPPRANQPVDTVAGAIKAPGISDEGNNRPPVIQSVDASESAANKLLSLAPSSAAGNVHANARGKKRWTALDPSTLFDVPDYARKRQFEANEATRNIAEKHGHEPYAQERATLASIVASARSANPPRPVDGQVASDSGNFGAALVAIQGVPEKLIASSYFWPKPAGRNSGTRDLHHSYRIVRNAQHHQFKSRYVGDHLRNVDSEAKIINFIADKIKGRTHASGSILLYTEIPPCTSCTGVISAFKKAFPNIELIVLDNEGNRPNS